MSFDFGSRFACVRLLFGRNVRLSNEQSKTVSVVVCVFCLSILMSRFALPTLRVFGARLTSQNCAHNARIVRREFASQKHHNWQQKMAPVATCSSNASTIYLCLLLRCVELFVATWLADCSSNVAQVCSSQPKLTIVSFAAFNNENNSVCLLAAKLKN